MKPFRNPEQKNKRTTKKHPRNKNKKIFSYIIEIMENLLQVDFRGA
jgi:hypothetical protein